MPPRAGTYMTEPKPTLILTRRRGHACLFITAAALTLSACIERDRSMGMFDIHASGGLQAVYRGPVNAVTQWSTYGVDLDLKRPGSPLRAESDLSFWFTSKPDSGVWLSTAAPVPDQHTFTIGLGDPQQPFQWQADSGQLHITTPRRRAGVSGSFIVFAHCGKCGPNELPSRTVLTGTFATHR